MLWTPAYVGVGSNLDQPIEQVRRALQALRGLAKSQLRSVSTLYGSRPLGNVPQPDFVNAAAALLTRLDAAEFLAALRLLEAELGREPARLRWGPRRIDLDLLVFGSQRIDSPQLTVPHPGIVHRNFVLYPLLELAPQLIVPGLGSIESLAARVDAEGIWRLDDEAIANGA
jgi:2-amino-4-hydroxy-6-hydroxymethyldihydropteridine diphosphokinase